jgi:MoxR-like ATPase
MLRMTPTEDVKQFAGAVADNVERVLVGKRSAIEQALVALLAGGHILIEDAPGMGKTMLARSIAISTGLDFKRIQCTPDLLPSDVTGVSVFDQSSGSFEFRPGPVFSHILLADEINRATPRTQSALLEAMGENQVTVDGQTRSLPTPFLVVATQNPIEFEGTFPLPEAQLDRFLLRLSIGYPSLADEDQMIQNQRVVHPIETLGQVVEGDRIPTLQAQVRRVAMVASVRQYLLTLTRATRNHPSLSLGASPRASVALFRAAQARAALSGRSFTLPDDVKREARACLAHRLLVDPANEMSGRSAGAIVDELLTDIPVPATVPDGDHPPAADPFGGTEAQ